MYSFSKAMHSNPVKRTTENNIEIQIYNNKNKGVEIICFYTFIAFVNKAYFSYFCTQNNLQ